MYDLVNINLRQSQLPEIGNKLEHAEEKYDYHTGETKVCGKLRNLYVQSSSYGMFLRGSLAKYSFGHNLTVLTRHDVKNIVTEISDKIGVNLENAKVTKLEFGYNFELSKNPKKYLSSLGGLGGYKKSVIADGETVQYDNSLRQLIFYDKVKELRKDKNKPFTKSQLIGKNILRYELKLKIRLPDFFRTEELKFGELSHPKVYNHLKDYWKNQYFKITRVNPYTVNQKNLHIISVKRFEEQLMSVGVKEFGGYENLLHLIDNESESLSYHQRFRLKKKLSELNNADNFFAPNQLLQELDELVTKVANEQK